MSASIGRSLHEYGYEGDVEEVCPVEEFHRATCQVPGCDWISDEFDALDWTGAEAAAVEHVETLHSFFCDECNDTVLIGEDDPPDPEDALDAHMENEHPEVTP